MLSPLIWTRSVADWDDDALLLPHHVRKVIHLPCLAVEFLQPALPEGDFPHVVATSANALAALERLPHGREKFAQATFLCFGPKTARRPNPVVIALPHSRRHSLRLSNWPRTCYKRYHLRLVLRS